jgi:hypothetical protein
MIMIVLTKMKFVYFAMMKNRDDYDNESVLRIRIREARSGSGSAKLDPVPDPHFGSKSASKSAEALQGHFGALEGPNLETSEWSN